MTTSPNSYDRTSHSAGRVASHLLLSIFALLTSPTPANANNKAPAVLPTTPVPIFKPFIPDIPTQTEATFTLRHVFHHGTYRNPSLHKKKDVTYSKSQAIYVAAEDGYPEQQIPVLRVKSRSTKIERLVDRHPSVVDPMVAAARQNGFLTTLSPSAWVLDDVAGPDVADKDTVISLAYMSSDAYARDPDEADWHDVLPPFNKSADFGWEGDGLRGHIFADETNSTIVIGLKGTSMAYFDGEGTTTNDKVNDNLFFSCCCAQQGQWSYHQVCDCATGTYTCNNTCVVSALQEENRYYRAGRELYSNVTELYPNANVWITGHSLGGAVSSLLGLTYGLPVVTFEAVPEALPASRLGLPVPPRADSTVPQAREFTGTYHFGHTADPVYIGTCSGATASCSYFGYAMESQCHTGFECVYDVVADKGWRVGIGTHRINSVIRDVILEYDTVPECKSTPECRDCNKWKMYWSNGTETTSMTSPTSTATKTRTRTATCQTPGWWGCLDESTSITTTTTISSSSSTSTCKTPGWFGCKDKTTIESTTTAPTLTTLTETPTKTTTKTTTTCETPGRFWGCYDEITTAILSASRSLRGPIPTITQPPSTNTIGTAESPRQSPTTASGSMSCAGRTWYGFCTEWAEGNQPQPSGEPMRMNDEM